MSVITLVRRMYFHSVYVLLLSCILFLSPLSESTVLSNSIHSSHSKIDTGISVFPPVDGFLPPESAGLAPPPYQSDTSGLPQAGTPNAPPNDDGTPPSIIPFVPPSTSNAPLPASPQLPFATPSPTYNPLPTLQFPFNSPPPYNSLPASPQLPFISPPPDSSLPALPQLPFGSSPPLYNTLPGSSQSPLAYHHPNGAQPPALITPAPFGLYPSGQNQNQPFGQSNAGLFGQPQGLNDVPFGSNGEYGGCSSTRVNMIGTAIAFIGVLLASWF